MNPYPVWICLLLFLGMSGQAAEVTSGQSHYFRQPEKQFQVRELDVSQQYILSRQRSRILNLMHRRLGTDELSGDRRDLPLLQRLVDQQIIQKSDVASWQAAGVVLGDVIANETNLRWVAVEDELGSSRALQWKRSQNFVFPVTLLSRRVQFDQAIDLQTIFDTVLIEVEAFKAWEASSGRLR